MKLTFYHCSENAPIKWKDKWDRNICLYDYKFGKPEFDDKWCYLFKTVWTVETWNSCGSHGTFIFLLWHVNFKMWLCSHVSAEFMVVCDLVHIINVCSGT